MPDVAPIEEQLAELGRRLSAMEGERDEYKHLYVSMMEAYRKLEAGLVRHHRERFTEGGEQTTLGLLEMLAGQAAPEAPPAMTQVETHARVKPTGPVANAVATNLKNRCNRLT